MINTKKTLLRSKTGEICITKCKEKNEQFVHPLTLQSIKENRNLCAIFPTQKPVIIPKSDSQLLYIDATNPWVIDECDTGDNDKYYAPDEIKMFLLTSNFDPGTFLKNIYNIKSFEDTIKWTLENNKFPFETIRRVHDCAWKVHGKNMENIPIIVYKYYYEIATNKWLNDYLSVIEQKYSFDIVNGKISEAILTNILTYDNFIAIIKKYVSSEQDKWENIISHYSYIKNYVLNFVIEELEKIDFLR